MSNSFTRKKIQNYSYGLGDAIGKGYSSQVYKGRNDQSNDHVAIKVIDLKMLKNDINKVLLESEIKILKELTNLPHILNLHDVFTTKNNTYIITQLCHSDFSKHIKKGLQEQMACKYMQQILTGYLQFATKDIIHRDLKPANILMTQDKELKIADFGFAIKAVDAHKSSKYNIGSPLYMAPESLRKNQYSLKTDIWALGVIFYELLMGQTPWKAKNQKQLVKKIESEKIEDILSKLQISLSQKSKDFLKKCLRIDKNLRWDVEELQEFTFIKENISNILGEKKMNIESRPSFGRPSITTKREKSRDNRLLADRSNENRGISKEFSQQKFNSFRGQINHSIQLKPNLNNKLTPSIQIQLKHRKSEQASKENPQSSETCHLTTHLSNTKAEKKQISKILVSEIHFCRFLYKLLIRISDSSKTGLLRQSTFEVANISKNFVGIIKHKIDNLVKFSTSNYIDTPCYEQYKRSTDYSKLMKISKQYRDRYSTQLKEYWKDCECSFNTNSTVSMIEHLHTLLYLRQNHQTVITSYANEIITLDYLITAKQLIEIFKNGQNFERFAKKSRIEEIVEGRTADITVDLFEKIMNRATQLVGSRWQKSISYEHKALLV